MSLYLSFTMNSIMILIFKGKPGRPHKWHPGLFSFFYGLSDSVIHICPIEESVYRLCLLLIGI